MRDRFGSRKPLVIIWFVFAVLALGSVSLGMLQHSAWLALDSEEEPSEVTAPPPDQFEFSWTRLKYHSLYFAADRSGQSWPTDYPKADRQFLQGVLRYTAINGRKVENIVAPSDPKLYDFPFVYAVEVGHWQLSDKDAAELREYLLRGGFLVVDDFHGTQEWNIFESQLKKIFPDREVREVDISDPIFHCFFDINEKIQVPGLQFLYSGHTYEKDGYDAHYRAVYDDNGRIMVMINFNVDLGDAWEWADLPQYPERYTSMAYRLGVNYIVYAMTH